MRLGNKEADLPILQLMNEDVPVLSFSYDAGLHRTQNIVSEDNLDFAPVSMISKDGSTSHEDLDWWWRHRSIPASRAHLRLVADKLGVEDLTELVERSLALSLSDRYWVRPHGSCLAWSDVNFYDNPFSDKLGVLTLTPSSGIDGTLAGDDLMTPNSTAGGDVPKKWCVAEDGTRLLLKAGTQLFDQDVYNEVAATCLYDATLAKGSYVSYRLFESPTQVFCGCEEFLGDHEEYVSCADVLRRYRDDGSFGTYQHTVDSLCEVSGLDVEATRERMSMMFSLDALLANFDRHAGNFGLIRDAETLVYKRFAPLFDAGASLWCDKRRLSAPSDYDYEPRPFAGFGFGDQWRHLRLFDDYRWLPSGVDLDAWAQETLRVLSLNPLMPDERLEAVSRGIDLNILNFRRHLERTARSSSPVKAAPCR